MKAQKFICKECQKPQEVESFEEIVKLKKVCLCCQRKALSKPTVNPQVTNRRLYRNAKRSHIKQLYWDKRHSDNDIGDYNEF